MAEAVSIASLKSGEQRNLVLDGLRLMFAHPLITRDMCWLVHCVAYVAFRRQAASGESGDPKADDYANKVHLYGLDTGEDAVVYDIVWDLIVEGILRPGHSNPAKYSNRDIPFFRLTERGKKLLDEGVVTPYDPDGYLAYLRDAVPGVDPTIMTYVEECLRAYRMGCPLAAAVTLGCASEKAFLVLARVSLDSLQTAARVKVEHALDNKPIWQIYREFKSQFDPQVKPRLPPELKNHLEVLLDGIFNVIRTMRNDAGHPTGDTIHDGALYTAIQMFAVYVKNVYDVIDWMKKNPQTQAP